MINRLPESVSHLQMSECGPGRINRSNGSDFEKEQEDFKWLYV